MNNTILIVDDNHVFVETLADSLVSSGERFRILTASNGAAALDLLGREQIDVLMTDLHMPVMDGMELLRRSRKAHPGLPAVVMSGNAIDEPQELSTLGVDAILEKPFSHAEALAVIRKLIAKSGTS